MQVKRITEIMNDLFPRCLQEKYDNSGAQLLFGEEKLHSILLSLDIDETVMLEAIEKDCNLILCHHPFFFRPVKSIDDSDPRSKLFINLVQRKISVFASHTNLDKVYHDRIGSVLGFSGGSLLLESNDVSSDPPVGFGLLVSSDSVIYLEELLVRVKERLDVDYLLYGGKLSAPVRTIALMNGSGGNSMERIISIHNPDCIITGDVGYHHLKIAIEKNIAVIDAGHFGTERLYLPFIKRDIEKVLEEVPGGNDITLYISEREQNPFSIFQ